MTITEPPAHIVYILEKLIAEGHDGFLVGGCVRDAVMKRPVHDWDLATSAKPVDVARLFSKTALTGEKFGTVTVLLPDCSVEVTTFRTEGDYIDSRRPEDVVFVKNIHDDLSRRDFTINAMAESYDGNLIDPYDGLDDIETGLIRCVGGPNTRFSEDALRMFRAFRFSAQLDFKIDHETLQAIYANAGLASRISTERIRIEVEKTLLSQRPEIIGEMIKIGLLDRYIALSGKNPEGLEKIACLPNEPVIRWCVLCAILLEHNYIRSVTEMLHDMHFDNKTIKTCVKALSIPGFPVEKTKIKQLLSVNNTDIVRCAAAVNDIYNDSSRYSALDLTDNILASGECINLNALAVTGHDLMQNGHTKGRELGDTLNKLLEHVIKYPEDNIREKLLMLADEISIEVTIQT